MHIIRARDFIHVFPSERATSVPDRWYVNASNLFLGAVVDRADAPTIHQVLAAESACVVSTVRLKLRF